MFEIQRPKYNGAKTNYYSSSDFITIYPTNQPELATLLKWAAEPCFLPERYANVATDIHNFEIRKDDIWIISYPKAGTTWTMEMIWLLQNNLDYVTAASISLNGRHQYLELQTIMDIEYFQDTIGDTAREKSPRFIKSHLPIALLPLELWTIKPKIIYVARNAKDTAISYYHHYIHMQEYKGTFNDFMDAFLADQAVYSPFHSHVTSFYEMRNEENVLFITYEDMKADLLAVLQTATKFLQKSYSLEELQKLQNHLSFESMRSNKSVNQSEVFVEDDPSKEPFHFIRKGKAGGFEDDMSTELIEQFDKWTSEKLKYTDFKFAL